MTTNGKPQSVRLVDVWLLGPFLMWAASRSVLSPLERTGLVVVGLLTILYNADNYLRKANG